MIASAFGWRSLARQLMGKLPMAGGIIPKAGIAYAGTRAIGEAAAAFFAAGGTNRLEESVRSRT